MGITSNRRCGLSKRSLLYENTGNTYLKLINFTIFSMIFAFLCENEQVSEEELHKLTGIFMVNGATIGGPKGSVFGKALFPIFSCINHNCMANAKFKIGTLHILFCLTKNGMFTGL